MITHLRQLVEKWKAAEFDSDAIAGFRATMIDAALDKQGHEGSVWIVCRDEGDVQDLAALFVERATARELSGRVTNHSRHVVIKPTTYHFITLGEDGTLVGISSPRFIDPLTLSRAVERLIRSDAEWGPL